MIDDSQSGEAPTRAIAMRTLEAGRRPRAADRIVVGIGDSGADHYRAALRLAARMSRQREATITLVHGCLPRLSIASGSEALERHLARGRQLVEEAGLRCPRWLIPAPDQP